MVGFLGIIGRPRTAAPFSLLYTPRQFSCVKTTSIDFSRNGFCRFHRFLRASLHSTSTSPTSSQAALQILPEQPEIVFVGTGTSEGIPRVSCLTNPTKTCPVCSQAAEPGNRNRRLNTSLLIRYPRPSGKCNILIDAGKFFYHSALRWFPTFGIRTLDAVIITHSHADAIGGLWHECLLISTYVWMIFVIGQTTSSRIFPFTLQCVTLRSKYYFNLLKPSLFLYFVFNL